MLQGISKIEIERAANKISVNIYTAKPGIVIGKGGTGMDVIEGGSEEADGKNARYVNVMEVRRPDVNAQLVAENVRLPAGAPHRLPQGDEASCIGRAMKGGIKGIKVTHIRPPGRC